MTGFGAGVFFFQFKGEVQWVCEGLRVGTADRLAVIAAIGAVTPEFNLGQPRPVPRCR